MQNAAFYIIVLISLGINALQTRSVLSAVIAALRLHIPAVNLQRLKVEADICALAELPAQAVLYASGTAVSLIEGDVAGHSQVHLNRDAVAYAASAYVVYAAHAGLTLGYLLYLPLYVVGQALLKQLV